VPSSSCRASLTERASKKPYTSTCAIFEGFEFIVRAMLMYFRSLARESHSSASFRKRSCLLDNENSPSPAKVLSKSQPMVRNLLASL